MTVIATVEFDYPVASRGAAGYPDGAHGGFGAGIDHAHLLYRGNSLDHHLCKYGFSFGGSSKAGSVAGCVDDGFEDLLVGMTGDHGSPGTDIIYIAFIIDINYFRTVSFFNKQRISAHRFKGTNGAVDTTRYD